MHRIVLQGETLLLDPDYAIFWPKASILMTADLHLGKGSHFRRAGIAVPLGVQSGNFTRLAKLLAKHQPQRVIFLGDLFHSEYNQVWGDFQHFIAQYPQIAFELVPGNHDILPQQLYEASLLTIRPAIYEVPPFLLSHHPAAAVTSINQDQYWLCGHIHPCVYLRDKFGRQSLRLPCFHFSERQGILPAFGEFTGMASIKTQKNDRVFVLAEGEVVPLEIA